MIAKAIQSRLADFDPVRRTGRVCSVLPTHVEADGPSMVLGELCAIDVTGGTRSTVMAEVVRVDAGGVTLSLLEMHAPIVVGATVRACGRGDEVGVGQAMLGHAINALGGGIDGKNRAMAEGRWPLHGHMPSPMERVSTKSALETGIRAIDGLLSLGIGQRIGLFAPSGVGKTTLLTQLIRQVKADVTVICLVGERGREVTSIWTEALTSEDRLRSILVAATSDESAAMRVRAVNQALAQAEYWRAQGKHVLFVLDSATRLAMAMREVGLAAGEPPTVRGYTPSVFAAMPKIVERCGAIRDGGAITAMLTILSEDEDMDDPVCEMMKSLLDGHILLSRSLAEQGQFPAIDILRSVSRQADGLRGTRHGAQARQVLRWLSIYDSSRTLVETGLYSQGSNAGIDQAIERHADILSFAAQGREEHSGLEATLGGLATLVGSGAA